MNEVPQIVIWTWRFSPLQVRLIESIARHTKGNYDLSVVCEPGNCHENMNRALDRAHSRYLCLLDEDVEILHDHWLEYLIESLKTDKALGAVGSEEIKEKEILARFKAATFPLEEYDREPKIERKFWIQAFVMCLDLKRIREHQNPERPFRFDENIPGRKGMTDFDACMQIVGMGLKIAIDHRVTVSHPYKSDEENQLVGSPLDRETWADAPSQRDYMKWKWGIDL